MIRYILISTLIFTQTTIAEEIKSKIIGSWKLDLKTTKSYHLKYIALTDTQKKIISHFLNPSSITYNSDGTGLMVMGMVKTNNNDGTEFKVNRTEHKFTFKIIGESESQVIIQKSTMPNIYSYSVLKFNGTDSYSYSLSDNSKIPGRIFFTRESPNIIKDEKVITKITNFEKGSISDELADKIIKSMKPISKAPDYPNGFQKIEDIKMIRVDSTNKAQRRLTYKEYFLFPRLGEDDDGKWETGIAFRKGSNIVYRWELAK